MNTPQAPVTMKPTMSAEMPDFPKYEDFSTDTPYGHGQTAVDGWDYETTLRLAWEARARLAVEALQTIVDAATEYTEYEHNVAHKALTAIGPLPPMDGEG